MNLVLCTEGRDGYRRLRLHCIELSGIADSAGYSAVFRDVQLICIFWDNVSYLDITCKAHCRDGSKQFARS